MKKNIHATVAPPTLIALLALVVAMAFLILAWFDRWLYTMEIFHGLSMGLSYDPNADGLLRLRSEALGYCQFLSGERLEECRYFQNVITEKLAFAHPLTTLLSYGMRDLLAVADWLPDLQRIALRAILAPAAIALAIWVLLTSALPRRTQSAAIAISFCLLVAAQVRDNNHKIAPDVIDDEAKWPALLLLVAVTGLVYLVARFPTFRLAAQASAALDWVLGRPLRLAGLAGLMFASAIVLPGASNWALQPAAFLILLLVIARLSSGKRREDGMSPMLWASLAGLLWVAVTADQYWYMLPLGPMRSLAQLLYVALIVLVTSKPRTRLVWLMPVLALFHVPITALLGAVTMVVEAVLCLYRRRLSMLLGASAVTFAAAFAVIQIGIASPFLSPDTARPSEVLAVLWAWPNLGPALLAVIFSLGFALCPLVQTDDERFARAGLLIVAGLAVALLSAGLLDNNRALMNAPGYALFTKSADYLTPALLGAGVLGLLLSFGLRLSEAPLESTSGSVPALLVAFLLLVTIAKADLRPRDTISQAWNTLRYLVVGEMHPSWCTDLWQVRLDDEVYVLSTTDPISAPVNYLSALKMRLRLEAGLYQNERFQVQAQRPNPAARGRK